MKSLTLFIIVMAVSINAVNASERTEKMCAKIKECALSDAAGQYIPEQMKAIVIQMIDTQCETMADRYNAKFEEAGLQDKSNACVDSIVDQSCDDLIATQGTPNTAACKDFEKAANEAGVELN